MLERRVRRIEHDGCLSVIIKQDSQGESIAYFCGTLVCLIKAISHLYLNGRLVDLAIIPIADIASFYGWLFVVIFCSFMTLWYAIGYEVITVAEGTALVCLQLGKHLLLSCRKYHIGHICDVELCRYVVLLSRKQYWKVTFNYSGRKVELETEFCAEKDGKLFVDRWLTPALFVHGG